VLTLKAPTVVTGTDVLHDAAVVVDDRGRIADVGPAGSRPTTVALPDGLLVPGFVEAQVNGGVGVDLMSADAEGWRRHARWLASTGVTSYCPTLVSAPVPTLAERAAVAREVAAADDPLAARLLGLHCEGPFLTRAGAHSPEHLKEPTPERVRELVAATRDVLAVVTLAPELPGALDAIALLAGLGVVVSVGHSDARADQVARAADAGATFVTHLFNAQSGLHHREPGVVGEALTDPRLTVGLIADHEHVHPTACRLVLGAAAGRVALVTDAVAAAGMPPGRYPLGDQVTVVEAGRAPRLPDGTLAGSGLTMPVALRNAVSDGYSAVAAVEAATRVPADLLGRPDLGRICPEAWGDLVWLADDLTVRAVWKAGRPVVPASR